MAVTVKLMAFVRQHAPPILHSLVANVVVRVLFALGASGGVAYYWRRDLWAWVRPVAGYAMAAISIPLWGVVCAALAVGALAWWGMRRSRRGPAGGKSASALWARLPIEAQDFLDLLFQCEGAHVGVCDLAPLRSGWSAATENATFHVLRQEDLAAFSLSGVVERSQGGVWRLTARGLELMTWRHRTGAPRDEVGIAGNWVFFDADPGSAAAVGKATIRTDGGRRYVMDVMRTVALGVARSFRYAGTYRSGQLTMLYEGRGGRTEHGSIVLFLDKSGRTFRGRTLFCNLAVDGPVEVAECWLARPPTLEDFLFASKHKPFLALLEWLLGDPRKAPARFANATDLSSALAAVGYVREIRDPESSELKGVHHEYDNEFTVPAEAGGQQERGLIVVFAGGTPRRIYLNDAAARYVSARLEALRAFRER